jgi:hypothetical protein
VKRVKALSLKYLQGGLVSLAMFQFMLVAPLAIADPPSGTVTTPTLSHQKKTCDHRRKSHGPSRLCEIGAPSSPLPRGPGGCKADLFPWVEVSVGAGANGASRAGHLNNATTEGFASMGFYNVLGAAPLT